MAATATCTTIPSSATTATRASRRSTRARARSSAWSSRAASPGRPLATAQKPASQPAFVWAAQLFGTLAIAFAIYLFFGESAPLFPAVDPDWARFGLAGILVAAAPALVYLRSFAAALNDDVRAMAESGGVPEPGARGELLRKLQLGGVLCELPLALGALYLLAGGEKRWFITAACVSLALRLSYRPFRGSRR